MASQEMFEHLRIPEDSSITFAKIVLEHPRRYLNNSEGTHPNSKPLGCTEDIPLKVPVMVLIKEIRCIKLYEFGCSGSILLRYVTLHYPSTK